MRIKFNYLSFHFLVNFEVIRISNFRLVSFALFVILLESSLKIEFIFTESCNWIVIIGDISEYGSNPVSGIVLAIIFFSSLRGSTLCLDRSKFRSCHKLVKVFKSQLVAHKWCFAMFLFDFIQMNYEKELMSLDIDDFRDINALKVVNCRFLVEYLQRSVNLTNFCQ